MKLVFNSESKVVAFGSHEGYEPFIADGQTLVEMSDEEAQPLIDVYIAELQASV
jgi:hypothetical protein